MSPTSTARKTLTLSVAGVLLMASCAGCARRNSATAAGSAQSGNGATQTAQTSSAPDPRLAPLPAIVATGVLEPPSYDGFEPLPIFTYHHVDPKLKNIIAITPATFEAQLQVLKSGGYHSITARELVEHQVHGTALPDRPVMITFDDGWRNQYTYAEPLLKKYGFTATFFINPQPISKSYKAYLTRDMVLALASDGNDIESHTWRHLKLIRGPAQSASTFQAQNMSQLLLANEWIRKVVGKQPAALCYPYGYYDTEAIGMAQRAGYKAGFTTDEGVADARAWDAYGMKRFTVQRTDTLDNFKARLGSAPLPVRDIQPPPANRVVGITTTVTVDITDVPKSVTGLSLTSGPSMKRMQIVERDGRRYAVALISKGKVGLRIVTARGVDASGKRYVSSWVLVLGDQKSKN